MVIPCKKTEEQIIDKRESNANEIWRAWIAQNLSRFLIFARVKTRNSADAEDVLQEALIEAWKKAEGEVPPDALIFRTISRRAIDLGRNMDARQRREIAKCETRDWWQPAEVEKEATKEVLLHGLAQLSQDLQEVVCLRIWGELSFKQIGEALDIPLPTASARFQRAIAQLSLHCKKLLI